MGRPYRTLHRFRGWAPAQGFTLIELLVVISIIALLATLTVGLTGVASRKSKEARIQSDLNKLVTAIEAYKATLGSYPRDNPGKPTTNQLYYELSGTFYENGTYRVPSGSEQLSGQAVKQVFNAPGFANSVRPGEKLKFTEDFKPSQYKEVNLDPDVEVLAVAVPGPEVTTIQSRGGNVQVPLRIRATDGTTVNPWMYDSSSPNRNNRQGFDLWTDVVIGGKVIRFSNWESGGVVVSGR